MPASTRPTTPRHNPRTTSDPETRGFEACLHSSHALMAYIRTPSSYTRRTSILQALDTIGRMDNFTLTLSQILTWMSTIQLWREGSMLICTTRIRF
jgi:hypothetical protein